MGSDSVNLQQTNGEKCAVTLEGIVEKILPAVRPGGVERAQIVLQGADDLFREIRIENALPDKDGKAIGFKLGDRVRVTIETANRPKVH
jgi:hypothetical protein